MIELSKTKRGLTVKLQADKKSYAYLSESDNIIYDFDDYRLNRTFDSLKGKKGVFVEKYKGITKAQLEQIQSQNNREINRLTNKVGLAESGGIGTMFKNKGII